MGDVYALMKSQPRVIGIIAGVFEQVPSVWRKEILYAMSQGMRVYGSSSMGALRAAKLRSFGMQGVGRIFEDFRDGVLEAQATALLGGHVCGRRNPAIKSR